MQERRAELEGRLAAVRERIAAACAAAGRHPDQVELMAVTKTVAAADVAVLLDLGLTLFGENRAQEAGAKVAEVAPGATIVDCRNILDPAAVAAAGLSFQQIGRPVS